MQASTDVLCAGELVFVGQVLQASDPGEDLYVPASQAPHGPPSGPEEPALQVQAVATRLPKGELEFEGQVSHVAAPVLDLKVPGGQAVQDPGPCTPFF